MMGHAGAIAGVAAIPSGMKTGAGFTARRAMATNRKRLSLDAVEHDHRCDTCGWTWYCAAEECTDTPGIVLDDECLDCEEAREARG